MTWTKTPPIKPGPYWWRTGYAPVVVRLLEVYISKESEPIACGHATHWDAESLGGEWCGPLVPVEELEKLNWNNMVCQHHTGQERAETIGKCPVCHAKDYVHKSEVEKAYFEGIKQGRDFSFKDADTLYKAFSRARRVVEGEGQE